MLATIVSAVITFVIVFFAGTGLGLRKEPGPVSVVTVIGIASMCVTIYLATTICH